MPRSLRLRALGDARRRGHRPSRRRARCRPGGGGAPMSLRIFVPRDSGALALGAEKVAAAIGREIETRGLDAKIVRNGSRGLYWLEPMVEVA
ncbi:MAG: formate dehydrogenase, partial [Pararhizobium sp.]